MSLVTTLTFIDHYLPGHRFGGPVQSLEALLHNSEGMQFKIVTRHHDHGTTTPYKNITPDAWTHHHSHLIRYQSPQKTSFKTLLHLLKHEHYDQIYLNSFFSFRYSILIVALYRYLNLKTPILLAPRGQFHPSALNSKKIKKLLFLKISRFLGLYKNIHWQASSALEKDQIIKATHAPSSHIHIAPDLIRLNTDLKPHPPKKILKIIFLSRISPMKNLIGSIKALKEIHTPVVFDIYGPYSSPLEKKYFNECLQELQKLPDHIHWNYKGALNHQEVLQTLKGYDLFLLPTFGENFGHVIIEALSQGLPVIIGQNTVWETIVRPHCGWTVNPNQTSEITKSLQRFISLPSEEQYELKLKAISAAKTYIQQHNLTAKKQNQFLFQELLNTLK